jgi:hypothetical protein
MTPKLASFLLGLSGLIALAIVSFWLLKRAYDMRERADSLGVGTPMGIGRSFSSPMQC